MHQSSTISRKCQTGEGNTNAAGKTDGAAPGHTAAAAIQPKLTVGQPDDPYEHEADSMADKIMRMPAADSGLAQEGAPGAGAFDGGSKNFTPSNSTSFVQRKCQHCEEEESRLHKNKIQDPFVQRSIEVTDDPAQGEPLNDPARSIPFAAKLAHMTSVIQGLCPSFTVDPSTHLVVPASTPAPTAAALAGGPHPVGCCGLEILTEPGSSPWRIHTSQLVGPHTESGGGANEFVLPPAGSDIRFGNFTSSNTRTVLNDVVIAGHEIIGHGAQIELGIHNQGAEDRESQNHHDPTIRIQNIIQHEQGLPASQDRGLAASGSHRGESFAVVEIDHFPFNVAAVSSLPAAERDKISQIAEFIKTNDSWVDVIGHSDPVGSPAAKQQVSDDRASAVQQQLFRLGVSPVLTKVEPAYKYIKRPRFTKVAGVSDTQPPAVGANVDENWRRVEIFVPNHPAGTEIPPADIPAVTPATPGPTLATEQASANPCHSLIANSAFPTPAASTAVPAPGTPTAVPAPAAPTAAPAGPATAPAAPAPASPAPTVAPFLQRKCAECEQDEKVQRKSNGTTTNTVSDSASQAIASSKGNGSKMDSQTENFMSSRFGVDLSGVNIHTNEESAGLNRELGARAFTTGSDIYFNKGQYQPGTESGKYLLAHELTHVIQQQSAGPAIQREGGNQTNGTQGNIKTLLLEETIDEEGKRKILFHILLDTNKQTVYYIEWDNTKQHLDEVADPNKSYTISIDSMSEYLITCNEENLSFGLVLVVYDTDGKTYKSIDPDGPIDKASPEAQDPIIVMRRLTALLKQQTMPVFLNITDANNPTDDKDDKKNDKQQPPAPVKPKLNFNIPAWFAILKELVLTRLDAAKKENKDNPYLPDKIFFYGSDLVQKQPGRANDWTIQVNKPGGQAYYSINESKWPTSGDKEQGEFADGVVKILFEKVQLILTSPPKDDKPIYAIDGTGHEKAQNTFQDDGEKALPNPFKGLSKQDADKLRDVLKQLAGDTSTDDKKELPRKQLSSNEVKALLDLANDPDKDKIIETLKQKTGGGVTQFHSLEELIAIAKVKDAQKEFNIKPDEDYQRVPPVVNRPVHGNIVQHDALIIAKKPVSFSFEVKDDVDALRVPYVGVRFYANSDPQSQAPKNWSDDKNLHYFPLDDDGWRNRKHWDVEFPAEGIYNIVAIVDHNFFLPNVFRTSVKVQDETKVLKDKEVAVYKGVFDPGTTSDVDFDLWKYSGGTVTRGKMASTFKGANADAQVAGIDAEIKRIQTVVDSYKKSDTPDGIAMVEWGEKYLEKLKDGRKKLTETRDETDSAGNKTQHILACKGTYVSRSKGVRSGDLKLTCFIKKDSILIPGPDDAPATTVDGYRVTLLDNTQLYENEVYKFDEFGETSEEAMKALFVKVSKDYPDGHISIAFQKWNDTTDTVTDEYVKYERVTDSLGKDIKSVVFSTPVSIAVNVVSAVLTVFPLTTGVGIALGVLYNGANTIVELQDEAEKGTLTGTKAATSIGSMVLDVLPILGTAGKAVKIVQLGKKAYYLFEGAQLAGQAFLMYENGKEEIEKLREDYFLKIAALDDQIAELESTNPSDPQLDKLKTERQKLIDEGRDAGMKVYAKMVAQQGVFFIGAKALHGVHEHYATSNKIAAREQISNGLTSIGNENERLVLADRIYEADIEVTRGKETKWIDEGGTKKLQVAEDATGEQIKALLDNPPAEIADRFTPEGSKSAKVEEEINKEEEKEQAGGEEDKGAKDKKAVEKGTPAEEATKSPVEDQGVTEPTALGEKHEYRIHKDGSITRCSDHCTLFASNSKGRAKEINNVLGKDHASSKKANEIRDKAAKLAKDAKKAAKIEEPVARKAEEDRLIGEAKQLELDMAVLEKGMITEVDQRVTKRLDDIKNFANNNPEHKAQFENRMKIRDESMKDVRKKLNDPDPKIRAEAWEALKREQRLAKELARDMQSFVKNLSKPDISSRFYYEEYRTKSGHYGKQAKGELGIPGEVRKHRSETEQGKVSALTGDDAGHLIANMFGAEGGERNLGRQNYIANEYGTWRQLEIYWAEKLASGSRVFVDIREISKVKGERPFMRTAIWEEMAPDGKVTKHQLDFGNFETAKSREAAGAAPTAGVPEGGGVVMILSEGQTAAPVYSDQEKANIFSNLHDEHELEAGVPIPEDEND